MAQFVNNTGWGIITACEAAGNSAALSPISVNQPLDNRFTAVGGTFEFHDRDIYIFAIQIWGDAANLDRVTLQDSEFSGARRLFDSRANQPAETSTAQASGFHDLRNSPIKIPAGDIPEWNWTEDASTNVEPHLVAFYCDNNPQLFNGPMYRGEHLREAGSCFDVTLAQSSTTAVTWTRSSNILGANNGDTLPFPDEQVFDVVGHDSLGSATWTASILEVGSLRPGIAGPMVDPNVNQIHFDPLMWDPIRATGKELNSSTMSSIDVAGSETPTSIFRIRRVA